ncbi:hypothetical protein [uncultured Tateyamaria sp.]|uniref:hypothetical protein n=1 Tax=uncultured Tateyamaria sp. TaxID=455651 RepID=UPI00261735F4|nr:hypothetical protein [uncultured Tateyamaria sp.]
MAIVLLLVSFVFGLAGATLASFAGFGLVMAILSYIASGMIGAVGVTYFSVRRCASDRRMAHSPAVPQAQQASGA